MLRMMARYGVCIDATAAYDEAPSFGDWPAGAHEPQSAAKLVSMQCAPFKPAFPCAAAAEAGDSSSGDS